MFNCKPFPIFLLFLNLLELAFAGTELLKNSDFESTNYNGNWICVDCKMQSSGDAYHGSRSVHISNRHHTWSSVQQTVTIQPNHKYYFKAFFKILNLPNGHAYSNVELFAKTVNKAGHASYHQIANLPMQQVGFGWTEIGGDIVASHDASTITIYIQIPEVSVEYMQDASEFQEIPTLQTTQSHFNSEINKVRKAPITLRLSSSEQTVQGLQVELSQTKHKFGFGTCVNSRQLVDSSHRAYQQFFYDNFEWAVLENALEWRLMEGSKGHANYNVAMNAVRALRSKGIPVRGHYMYWGVEQFVPSWLKQESRSQVQQDMKSHLNEVISHTRGTLEHWDVNNENLHGDWYEQHTGNPNITMDMFRWMHNAESGVKLFLNEYNVVSTSDLTTALKNQGKRFKDANLPIYGIGVQGHFWNSHIDYTRVKYRLDKIAEAGLPIWITELTISENNETIKANALKQVLNIFFSHPAVEGILLWGYWDQNIWRPDSALATGSNVTPNAAGRAYQNLFHNTWRTHETHSISPGHNVKVSGFLGKYTLNVKHNGNTIHTEAFNLDKPGTSVNINLNKNGNHYDVPGVAFG